MANDTSFVMSVQQAAELDHAFSRNSWTLEDVKWLSAGDNLATIIGLRRGTAKVVQSPFNTFSVTVNYDLSVEDAVTAGKYDWKNSDITGKHFPRRAMRTAETEITLVHFDRYVESEDVIRELDKQGLRPAELPELLAFGAKYPDVQREFPVVALGSVWRRAGGGRHVACLSWYADERRLFLYWFKCRWYAYYRFAAVRK